METRDWGEATLQQALTNISNFHETNLNSKKMIYKNKTGDLKDFQMNKKTMKIMSAVKLIKRLPGNFEPLKHDLLSDMSDAFFNPEINYEDVVNTAELRAKERGHTMLFSEIKIKNQPAFPYQQNKKQVSRKIGREFIKKNKNERGTTKSNLRIREIFRKSNICMFCLTTRCRQEQLNSKRRAKCGKNPSI